MSEMTATLWHRLRFTRLRDALCGRFDASLDWRRVIADADLPPEITDTITAVVDKSRLWRSEKVDVARELAAHFQDGLDAGRTPQQLVEAFGDPASAAQLIRRAKKRGRPLAWHVVRCCLILYIGFSLIYLLFGLYVLSGRPSIKVDYLAIINERANSVPEVEHAWPLYRDALSGILTQDRFPDFVEDGGLSDESKPLAALEWLKQHCAPMDRIRTATSRPVLGFQVSTSAGSLSPEDRRLFADMEGSDELVVAQTVEPPQRERMLIEARLPHLRTLRSAAWLLMRDAHWAAFEGDGERAMADVAAMLGVSRHCQELPFMVSLRMATHIQEMAFATIEEILSDRPELWSDAELRDLAHVVAAAEVDWRSAIEGERAIFDDIVQRVYTDDHRGDGRPVFSGFGILEMVQALSQARTLQSDPEWRFWSTDGGALLSGPAGTMIVASRKEMSDLYHSFMDCTVERFEQPLWQLGTEPVAKLKVAFDSAPFGKWQYCLVAILAPSLERTRLSIAARDGERDGVLVGVALELYHREHGGWPKSLAELSPRWLPEVPVDRITGQPLGYKIVDDRPVVYSVGADRDDDSGRVPQDEDGRPNTFLAAPTSVDGEAVDGDWVIWSTVAD